MRFKSLDTFKECKIYTPDLFIDERGYFTEIFRYEDFDVDFIQDNESRSNVGVIRGMHWQVSPYGQDKLVRVPSGSIIDVVVDIRKNSPTFGQFETVYLSSNNKSQLFIPKGFAHGFLALESSIVLYKCSNVYNKKSERSLNPFSIGLDWKGLFFGYTGGEMTKFFLSEKDINAPDIKDIIPY